MKTLLEVIGFILLFCFFIAVDFVFQGDPSLFDMWHDQVIGNYTQSNFGK